MLGHAGISQEPVSSIPATSAGLVTQPQRLFLWKPVALMALGFFAEEQVTQSPVDLTPFRNQATAVTAGQSYRLWPRATVTLEPEDFRPAAPATLLPYRNTQTVVTTVGQPWQYWIKPQQRIDSEDYIVPGPASLFPYRQITLAALPGQPWWMWPAAKADQTIEPNPVVIDHAAALYPFRPHPAIIPPAPVSAEAAGLGGWAENIVRQRRAAFEHLEQQEADEKRRLSELDRQTASLERQAKRTKDAAKLAQQAETARRLAAERQQALSLIDAITVELSVAYGKMMETQKQAQMREEEEAFLILLALM
jgi:hypothetical protein